MKVVYEAVDGTFFTSKEECRKYEESAEEVVRARYDKLLLGQATEMELYDIGCEDTMYDIIRIESEEDLFNANMLAEFTELGSMKIDPKYIGKTLIVYRGQPCYDENYFYPVGTIDEVLNRIRKNYNNVIENK